MIGGLTREPDVTWTRVNPVSYTSLFDSPPMADARRRLEEILVEAKVRPLLLQQRLEEFAELIEVIHKKKMCIYTYLYICIYTYLY